MSAYCNNCGAVIDEICIGKDIEVQLIETANTILTMMAIDDYVTAALDEALDNLQKRLKRTRKEFKA